MARGSLSFESTLIRQLDALQCSHRDFCALADFKPTTLSEILNGTRDFTPEEKERAESVIQEMIDLRQETTKLRGVSLSLNWADPSIGVALVIRRVVALDREIGRHTLDELASRETERIARQ